MTGKIKKLERLSSGFYLVRCSESEKALGEIVQGDGGFWAFCPFYEGDWSAVTLRSIADRLDELNSTWEAEITRYVNKLMC